MKITDKIINIIKGKNLSDGVALFNCVTAAVLMIIGAAYSPELNIHVNTHLCLGFSLAGTVLFCLSIFAGIFNFENYGHGWGNPDYYESYFASHNKCEHKEPCLYFPVYKYNWIYRITSDSRHRLHFKKYLAKRIDMYSVAESPLENKMINELSPELVDLYISADYNGETRRYYKSIIPQIKDLYIKFRTILQQLENPDIDERVRKYLINNLDASVDEIIIYIRNLKEPMKIIIQYSEDVKNATYELNDKRDMFAGIKIYNQLTGTSEVDYLTEKYDLKTNDTDIAESERRVSV